MIRVAYVCADPGVPVYGAKGASIHVQEVIRALSKEGAHVSLFATRVKGDPPPDLAAIPLHRLPRPKGQDAERERAALAANDALRAALVDAGPFDLVYERHSLWSYAAMEHARETGVPGLLEVNAPLLEEQRRFRTLSLPEETEAAVNRAFAAASGFLCVSDAVADSVRASPAVRAPIHVVPNGVDTGRFDPGMSPALARDDGTITIGFVGSLKPWHDLASLVVAFATIHRRQPSTRLLVVGDGPGRAPLEAAVAEQGLGDAVVVTGMVRPDEVPGLVCAIDIAVAPYPPLEPFYFSPLKVMEYMAAGRPIVGAAIGQMTQLIEHGESGLLYAPGDTTALTESLQRLLEDPALRARLGERARQTALDRHSWQGVAQRILLLTTNCARDIAPARTA
ncbi:MAG: glycosyltransferase family 4 protein [Planctomycetota bacterium]